MKYIFFGLIYFFSSYSMSQSTWATKPVNSLKYSLPSVFEKQREIIYGDDEAEIYFSLVPHFNVEQVLLTLKSSHPKSLLIKSADKLLPVTNQYIYTQKNSISKIRFQVSRKGRFSLASVAVKIEFKFPKEEVIDWVKTDPEKRYSVKEAREELIQRIKSVSEMTQETIGIFLYRGRFLMQR